MKELDQAFKSKQQIIALGKKPKVIKSGNNGGTRKPPKYFVEFRDQMLEFIQEQRKFNKNQEKFNKYVLDVFNRNNLK